MLHRKRKNDIGSRYVKAWGCSLQLRAQNSLRAIICAMVLALLWAVAAPSAHGATKDAKEDKAPRPTFYPLPPDMPRVQFLTTINGEGDFAENKEKKKKKGGFRRFIVGQELDEDALAMVKPFGLTLHDGKLFVCESQDNYIIIFDMTEGTVEALGRLDPGRLMKPINIAVDKDGTRYVVDTTFKRIMIYDTDNEYVKAYGDPEKMAPTDLAILDDELFVVDIANSQVVVLDKNTGKEKRRMGRRGIGEGELIRPTNIAVDPDANVYVVDSGNWRVVRFNPRGRYVREFGSIGRLPGQFARPKGIAIDPARRVHVVDTAFGNVQIFSPEGDVLMFYGALGEGPGGLSLPAQVITDTEHVDYFRKYVAPDREIEFVMLVTSQWSPNKVNVYGFLKTEE
jgi:6-bladed beta-propeller protein